MQCNAVTDQCQWPIGAQLGQSRIVEPDQRDESSFPYCIRIDANSIPPISLLGRLHQLSNVVQQPIVKSIKCKFSKSWIEIDFVILHPIRRTLIFPRRSSVTRRSVRFGRQCPAAAAVRGTKVLKPIFTIPSTCYRRYLCRPPRSEARTRRSDETPRSALQRPFGATHLRFNLPRTKDWSRRGPAVGWSMAPIEPFSNQCWLKIGVIRYIIRRSKRPAGSGVLGLPKNHP